MHGAQRKMSSNFSSLPLLESFKYSSDGSVLPIDFYLNVMPLSTSFYLKLGYFNSKALRLLACSFAQFIYNGGRLNILSNHFMEGEGRELVSTNPLSSEELRSIRFYSSG